MSRFRGVSISIGLVLPTFKEGNGDTSYLFTVSILVFERYVIGEKRHIILEPRMFVQKIEQIINNKQDRAVGYPRRHFSKLKCCRNCGEEQAPRARESRDLTPGRTGIELGILGWGYSVGKDCGKARER